MRVVLVVLTQQPDLSILSSLLCCSYTVGQGWVSGELGVIVARLGLGSLGT